MEKKGANQRRKNQGNSNERWRSLDKFEVPIALEQAWMVTSQKINCKKNPFFSSDQKFYIKYGKHTCYCFHIQYWNQSTLLCSLSIKIIVLQLEQVYLPVLLHKQRKMLLLHLLQVSKIRLIKHQVKSYQ